MAPPSPPALRAVVGLGNPGPEYAATRHNAGFRLLDAAHARWRFPPFARQGSARVAEGSVGGERVVLAKPSTYMNLSGTALPPVPARDLLILTDDFALALGTFRLRARGSAGGHKGLLSVEEALATREYARLRIGVGPLPEGVQDWADFVLERFTRDEAVALEELLPTMVDAVESWIAEGIERAMTRFNK